MHKPRNPREPVAYLVANYDILRFVSGFFRNEFPVFFGLVADWYVHLLEMPVLGGHGKHAFPLRRALNDCTEKIQNHHQVLFALSLPFLWPLIVSPLNRPAACKLRSFLEIFFDYPRFGECFWVGIGVLGLGAICPRCSHYRRCFAVMAGALNDRSAATTQIPIASARTNPTLVGDSL